MGSSKEREDESNPSSAAPNASPDNQQSNGKSTENHYFKPMSERTTRLPALFNHFNWRDMKMLFKCSLAVWIYLLFIWIDPLQSTFGQATFFGAIVLFIAPPSGVVFMGLLAVGTLIIGVCLAWAWGTITMKAALATRPAADLQQQFAALQKSANTTNNQQASGQSQYTQIAIYNGALLDNRVTVTYFCMIGLFVYFMARLRVKAPKLALTSIFGLVISDIYLTIAPLIPTFQGTIPQVLIKPAALAAGIGVVCNILFFPKTTSSIVLDGMQDMLQHVDPFIDACIMTFHEPSKEMEYGRLNKLKGEFLGAYKALQPNVGFLSLDLSYGPWSPNDLKKLQGPMRQMLISFLGIVELNIARMERKIKDKKLGEIIALPEDSSVTFAGHYHAAAVWNMRKQLRHPDCDELLEKSMGALASSCPPILKTCQEAVSAIASAMNNADRSIFRRAPKGGAEERRKEQMRISGELKQHISELSTKVAHQLWEHYSKVVDNEGNISAENEEKVKKIRPLQGLVTSLLFEERILNFATAVESLLATVSDIEKRRHKSRVWSPFGFSKLFKWGLEKDTDAFGSDPAMFDSDEETLAKIPTHLSDSETSQEDEGDKTKTPTVQAAEQLETMQKSGIEKRSRMGRILISTSRWIGNTEGIFALRMVVVTIALGVVAVTSETAGFFYREKGLWALIMAQTGLVPYTADFILGIILRVSGTIIGAVLGLVCWYIGAGNGPGNPFGMAAIVVPVIIALMWIRLFASPLFLQGCVMSAATCFLVIGYSWADTHIPSYGNPGVGYEVFWRRMLLVLIGFGAAAIVMLLPRPPSASRHQRRLLSGGLSTVKNQYALFVLNCREPAEDLAKVSEGIAIQSAELLMGLEPQIKLSMLEFSTSNIDSKTMARVCHIMKNLNQFATELLVYTPQLSPRMKDRFIRNTRCLEERTIADIMAVLTLVAQALRTGDPLPAVMPVLSATLAQRSMGDNGGGGPNSSSAPLVLSEDILRQEGARKFCCAMVAFAQLLGAIDDLSYVVKRAVGETSRLNPKLFV